MPPLGTSMARTFASYRAAIEQARDDDEPQLVRKRAWSRAANQRARLERMFAAVGDAA